MTAFEEYVEQFGMHFNKNLCEWAVSMMRDRNGAKVPLMTKEQTEEWLKANGVVLKNNKG